MHRFCWIAGLTLIVAGGCAQTKEERAAVYNDLGVDLFQKGDYVVARDSFKQALALTPNDAALFYNRGECYARLGDLAQAEQDYRSCLTLEPAHIACRHALDVVMLQTKRESEVQKMIADWLTKEPKSAAAYAEQGWLLRMQGDLPAAQGRLQQALNLDPHDERALTEMALTFEALNRPDRALVLYDKILERKPAQPELVDHVNFLLAKGAKPPRPD